VARLSGREAAADRLRAQLAAADACLSDRDSSIQLLHADKAYLGKQAQVAEARVAELTSRLAVAEEKVTNLKDERSRLYQQLAEASSASRVQVGVVVVVECCSGGGSRRMAAALRICGEPLAARCQWQSAASGLSTPCVQPSRGWGSLGPSWSE
jgi:hypothetical protein